jgi:5'-nucleotidase / UDP-sugar diphosphatase
MILLTRRRFTGLAAISPFAVARTLAGAGSAALAGGEHQVTLLYTNDFHSAFHPIPAYWLAGMPRLGGAPHLATSIEQERARVRTSFLLDSGDMYTGTLSLLTHGEALMEMMTVMGYDAMGVGNHEFDYGWEVLEQQITRVPFPVLCCNVRYRQPAPDSRPIRFCRPYSILEKNGVRLGVIGVLGARASRYTIMPSRVTGVEFLDPVAETAAWVRELRRAVDVVVVLAHQGLPGPMQTDAENDASVQRPLDEDLDFCGAIPGIDVYIAAHSHHGLEQPLAHPRTGTLLVQTYGYGTRLGVLDLSIRDRRVVAHRGELKKIWADELSPSPAVAARVAYYTQRVAAEIGPDIGRANSRFIRKYNAESPLGSFVADVMRERLRCDAAITNAGGLRADLPQGALHRGHVLDALPFLNDVVALEMTGKDLRAAVEQGLSLAAGMCQVSGLTASYDLAQPVGARAVDLRVGGAPIESERRYRVATNSFLAEGGDRYASFQHGRVIARAALVSDCVIEHLRAVGTITPPAPGRLQPVAALALPSRAATPGAPQHSGQQARRR